jgi:hypothetical protein
MVTLAETGAAVTTLRSLYDVIRAARDSEDPRKLKAAVDEAYERLLTVRADVAALQEANFAAARQVAALEEELKAREVFEEKEQANYELYRFHPNAFAFLRMGGPAQGDAPRYCQPCFANKKLSMLHPTAEMQGRERYYFCPCCKDKFLMGVNVEGKARSNG